MKNRFVIYVWMLLVGLSLRNVYAQTQLEASKPLKFKEILRLAMENSYTVQVALLDKRNTHYRIQEAKSAAYPQINAQVAMDNNLQLPTQLIPGEVFGGEPGTQIPARFGTKYQVTAGLEARQLLFDQSFFSGLKAIRKAEELNDLQVDKAREAIVYETARVYYLAEVSQRQQAIVEANLAQNQQLIEITRYQYENGLVQKTDVDRLLVNQINLQTEKEGLETDYQEHLNKLKYLCGLPLDAEIILEADNQENSLILAPEKPNFDQRLDLRLLRKQNELEILQQDHVRAGYYPKLYAYAKYQQQALRDNLNLFAGDTWFGVSVIGLQLDIPIFDGFQKRNLIQQSEIRLKKLELESQDRIRDLNRQYRDISNRHQNRLSQVKHQEQNMALAQDVYRNTQQQYQEGLSGLSDLLQAETAQKEAQTLYLQALVQLKLAELDYIESQGNLLNELLK